MLSAPLGNSRSEYLTNVLAALGFTPDPLLERAKEFLLQPADKLSVIIEASVSTAQQQSFEDGKLARVVLRMRSSTGAP
jgi:hypothetical protein